MTGEPKMAAAAAVDGSKSSLEEDRADPPPSVADVERPPPAGSGDDPVSSVVRRWKREDLLEKGTVLLRSAALAFALISLLVMASNKHGEGRDFDEYEEYRYCVAITTLAFLYSLAQILRKLYQFNTGRDLLSKRTAGIVDFTGDQVTAYLLISASSAAIPMTNRIREGADNLFTDASSAAISMAFFAFISLALSALISGYKISKQAYI